MGVRMNNQYMIGKWSGSLLFIDIETMGLDISRHA